MFDYHQYGGLITPDKGMNPYENMIEPGVHRIKSCGVEIDFLCQDIHNARERGIILVCFGGALKDRAHIRGPFFSGTKIGKMLQIPLISISDPTLERCPELLLSWYMGAAGRLNLPQIIAKHLDNIADVFQSRLILFGGSGGGFGILNVQPHMQSFVCSVVWNPQTLISNYIPRVVHAYARHAFGHIGLIDGPEAAEQFFSASGLSYDVTGARMNKGTNLYLQNAGDNHVENHMKPLLAHGRWNESVAGVFENPERGITVGVATWGEKHAVLPKPALIKALRATIEGKVPSAIAQQVQQDYSGVVSVDRCARGGS